MWLREVLISEEYILEQAVYSILLSSGYAILLLYWVANDTRTFHAIEEPGTSFLSMDIFSRYCPRF